MKYINKLVVLNNKILWILQNASRDILTQLSCMLNLTHCLFLLSTNARSQAGNAVALHCCKANERINRKTGNSTPCKIVTPENFNSKVCTRDYVGDGNYYANFCENRFTGGFSPNRWNITPLWLFDCPVLSFFFSILRPGWTGGPIFTLYGSNDVFPRKEVPFAGHDDR